MSGVIKKAQYLLGLIFMMFFLSACTGDSADSWPKQTGQVLDEVTNKPIENAIVVARWKGVGGFSKSVCFHVESTIADKDGKFTIPAWKNDTKWKQTENQHKTLTVYKGGYKESNKTYKERTDKEGRYYQLPFEGTREDWLRYLLSVAKDCTSADSSENNLLPLYETLYKEANSIAATKQEKIIVNALLNQIDLIKLPYDEVLKRVDERYKEIREEFPYE